jgi:L-lysine 2,3-aminomutase
MLILQALLTEKCTHACCYCSRRLSSLSGDTNKIQTASSNNKEIPKKKGEITQISDLQYDVHQSAVEND